MILRQVGVGRCADIGRFCVYDFKKRYGALRCVTGAGNRRCPAGGSVSVLEKSRRISEDSIFECFAFFLFYADDRAGKTGYNL